MASTGYLALYLFAVIGIAVASGPGLPTALSGAGRAAGIFVGCSLALLLVAQVYFPNGRSYPYVSWTMYTQRTASPPSSWRVDLVRASGTRERLNMRAIIRGPNARALMRHLELWVRRVEASPHAADRTVREVDEFLEALNRLDRRRRSDDPIVLVEFQRCTLLGPVPWTTADKECRDALARPVRE